MAVPKPNFVEIELFRGKSMKLKKTNGKVYGGIVNFKEADPSCPVIWLGQKSYCITNLQNKKVVLFYDTLSKTLFKPSDMASTDDSVDMVTQTTQNVLLAGKEAQQALGIQESTNVVFKFALAMVVVLAIFGLIFVYLIATHQYSYGPAAGATAKNVTTTIATPIGGSLVPVPH